MFAVACHKDEEKKKLENMTLSEIKQEIQETKQNIEDTKQNIQEKLYPPCEEKDCPEQEDCNCDFKQGQIKLSFDNIRLLRKDNSAREQGRNFFYQGEEYDKLKSVKLYFKPRCNSETTPLTVKINNKKIFDEQIDCQELYNIDIDTIYIEVGRNTLTFISKSEEEYLLTNIKVESELNDNLNMTDDLFDIEFEDYQGDEELFENLEDAALKNYVEYEIYLDEEESEQDIILEFDAEEREGNIIILLNELQVFKGDVDKEDNRITFSADKLKEGDNLIKIIGVSE